MCHILFIHESIGELFVFTFWLLWIMLLWRFLYKFCLNSVKFWGMYLSMELLGHVICVCALVAQLCPTLCKPMDSCRLLCPWGFSRQKYWRILPCPPPGDLPNPGTEPKSPALQADSLHLNYQGSPMITICNFLRSCQTVSCSGCTILYSHQQCIRVPVLHVLNTPALMITYII